MSEMDAPVPGLGEAPAPAPREPERPYTYGASPAVGASLPADPPATSPLGAPASVPGAVATDTLAPAPEPRAPAKRRRWVTWLAWSLMIAALLAMLGVSAYLIVAINQWRGQVDELMDINADLGEAVATLSEERDAAEAASDLATDQLEVANARITDLANEEANALDNQQIMVDFVEAALDCADARQEHIDAINRGIYTRSSLTRQEDSITEYCDDISSTFAEYKADEGLGS